jgi:hypothetical protein
MTQAFERVKRDFRAIFTKLHEAVSAKAGKPMRMTLIVWDSEVWSEGASEARPEPKRYGLTNFRASTLDADIMPSALRAVADEIERENASKKTAHQ